MRRIIVVLSICLMTGSLLAKEKYWDIELQSGKLLQNVRLIKLNTDTLQIIFSESEQRIHLKSLVHLSQL